MSAVIVLQQMLVLFSMIAIGVFLWKKNWIDVKGQKALSKMVVNIFNPLLLIYSISGYDFEKSTMNVGQNMVFVIVYFVLLFLMGFVVAFLLRLKKPQKNFYQMMMLFSNIGFVGIPIVTALLGREYVLYIAFYTLVYNVLLYTYGIYLAIKSNVDEGGTSVFFPIKRILNPGVVGCVIAILIFLCGLDIGRDVFRLYGKYLYSVVYDPYRDFRGTDGAFKVVFQFENVCIFGNQDAADPDRSRIDL